jgi:hypothetical protein
VTPQAILDSLRRADQVCIVCRGSSLHPPIVGDGVPVCYPCVLSLGRFAAEPLQADPDRLVDLERAHGDVVELRPCEQHRACWAWTGWAA